MAIVCIELSFIGLTNEGNEFFGGFFRNRFGLTSEQESIDPVLELLVLYRLRGRDLLRKQGIYGK